MPICGITKEFRIAGHRRQPFSWSPEKEIPTKIQIFSFIHETNSATVNGRSPAQHLQEGRRMCR